MSQIYWMIIILIQTQCIYGMERSLHRQRTADQAAVSHMVAIKKMRFTNQDQQRSEASSGRSSGMQVCDNDQDEKDASLGIDFTDEDMRDVAEALEEVRLTQLEAEAIMTQDERDDFDRLALIRAIGDGTSSGDENSTRAGEDRDWQ